MTLPYLRRRGLAALILAALALAGCTQTGGGSNTVSAPPPTASPPPPASLPAGSAQPQSTCTNLTTQGQALATQVTQFADGKSSPDQVRTAAQQLSATISAAGAALGPQVKENLDDASGSVQEMVTALNARPVDVAGLRTAAGDTLDALHAAVAVCQPTSGSPATGSPSTTP